MRIFSGNKYHFNSEYPTNGPNYRKPIIKGGHTHNHQRNALERKLNRSKESRKRTHNVLNKGYEYKFVLNRGNLVRVK